jgi:ABC-type branched-subunit amino acid transport system ATPase component
MLLEVRDLNTYYEQSHILQGISLAVDQGEIVCLLGRNGVGKSTTLKSIIGMVPPRSGEVLFKGQNMAGMALHAIAKMGVGYVPEDRRIFPTLTVRENLIMGVKPGRPTAMDGPSKKSTSIFPVWGQGTSKRAAIYPAGNSKCSRSPGHLWETRRCF